MSGDFGNELRANPSCPTCRSLGAACHYHATADYDTWIEVKDASGEPFETGEEREARILADAHKLPLVSDWCDCGEDTGFRCYPGDGECACGVFKHHVHGQCGHVVQIG